MRAVSVNKERVVRWVKELREEQEKSAQEEARKEEILQMLSGLAKLSEHQRCSERLRLLNAGCFRHLL